MRKLRVIYDDNYIYWYFNGKAHRDGGLPTDYYFKNRKLDAVYYHQHGKRHRTTGPAHIGYKSKIKRYWCHGKKYASLEEMLMMEACR